MSSKIKDIDFDDEEKQILEAFEEGRVVPWVRCIICMEL